MKEISRFSKSNVVELSTYITYFGQREKTLGTNLYFFFKVCFLRWLQRSINLRIAGHQKAENIIFTPKISVPKVPE